MLGRASKDCTFLRDIRAGLLRRGGTAATDRLEGGRVVLIIVRVGDEVEPHGGHTGEAGDAFVLDVLEGRDHVPLEHEHELAALQHGREEDRVRARYVEQGHRDQAAALLALVNATLARSLLHRHSHAQRVHGAHDSAVGGQGALRIAGGATGVEQRSVVVLCNVDVRHRGARVRCQHVRIGGHHLVGAGLRPDSDHGAQTGALAAEQRSDQVEALLVTEQDLGATIVHAVLELLAVPQRVDRDDDGSDGSRSHEGDAPFRVVAARDGHAVTLLHGEGVHQRSGDRVDLGEGLLERVALVLVDDEIAVAEVARVGKQLAQRQAERRALVHAVLLAAGLVRGLRLQTAVPVGTRSAHRRRSETGGGGGGGRRDLARERHKWNALAVTRALACRYGSARSAAQRCVVSARRSLVDDLLLRDLHESTRAEHVRHGNTLVRNAQKS